MRPRSLPPESEPPCGILLVASADAPLDSLEHALDRAGWRPERVHGPGPAIDRLSTRGARTLCAVLAHHSAVPTLAAATLLDELATTDPGLQLVFVTAQAHRTLTLELLRRGAFCVLPEPVDTVTLLALAHAAGRLRQTLLEASDLRTQATENARLALVGRLAADVVHELNSPLDGVGRFIALALDSLAEGALERPYLEEARRGLSRMTDIVRDLLDTARRQEDAAETAPANRPEDAGRMIREATRHVLGDTPRTPGGHPVELFVDVPRSGALLPRAMFQVLVNVVKNAADAMPRGGALEIALRERGSMQVVSVSDTGAGIPATIQARVREPFFTTKGVGHGTGLGLSLCERIVEQLAGRLEISSVEGCGTTVRIVLPSGRAALLAARPSCPGG